MDWKWNYGESVLVLPGGVLSAEASGEQLRVLLWLASDAGLAAKPAQLARLAGCRREELEGILAFWQGCGVLQGMAPAPAAPAAKEPAKALAGKPAAGAALSGAGAVKAPQRRDGQAGRPGGAGASGPAPAAGPGAAEAGAAEAGAAEPGRLRHADELPVYSSEELAGLLEQRESLRLLIDEAQNIFGKMFTMHEVNLLVGMVDYLGLDGEYILVLLAHCRRMEMKSLRAVERYAISLLDQGVDTAAGLEARVQALEAAHTLEGQVRAMFGLKSRALTGREKKFISAWLGFGYGEEIVRRAYEITVNSTGGASLSYANAILERWNAEGLRTAQEIDARLQAEREAKAGRAAPGSSFDTDDFFEAALRRSFADAPPAGQAPGGNPGEKVPGGPPAN